MDRRATPEHVSGIDPSLPSHVSRRAFLAGAAACAAVNSTFLRAAFYGRAEQAVLHLATRSSQSGHVHTFALKAEGCEFLGSAAIDSFAAFAAHPRLPVLYVARDCSQWQDLPRGVIETYAVECGAHPLRLLAQTPMALSATGPRSLAVAPCGRHLLVSASTGGAWNAFALDREGIPASVAIARKETGAMLNSHTVSLPTPHALVFSPHGPFAVGADPGSQRMTLLRPSPTGIAVLTRWETTYGLTPLCPAWTTDGRYIIAANAQTASLSIYEIRAMLGNGSKVEVHLLGTVQTTTPIKALLSHPTEPAVFTARPHGGGSRLELWKMDGSHLRVAGDTWVSGDVVALAQHSSDLWLASEGRLTRISMRDLRGAQPFEVPLYGTQAIITQSAVVHRFGNV
jgi:6-phosphogluconolactonase (cycloisomerase 2 family)